MGGGSWSATDWSTYKTTKLDPTAGKAAGSSYTARSVDPKLTSVGIDIREARDSVDHPNTTPIIVALDVTGSMNGISDKIQRKLGDFMKELLDRKPVPDPQLMFMGVGDAYCDSNPLQVTQFESDIRIAEQLEKIYLENGGGGNNMESYNLAWYFAANHTSTDSYEKRGKPGFMFTIGDDGPGIEIEKRHIKNFIGADVPSSVKNTQIIDKLVKMYNIYHIEVGRGGTYDRGQKRQWNDLLGERVIHLSEWDQINEVLISAIQVLAGAKLDDIADTWSGSTSLVVRDALKNLTARAPTSAASGGVIRL